MAVVEEAPNVPNVLISANYIEERVTTEMISTDPTHSICRHLAELSEPAVQDRSH